jgi:hypothetical protein
MERFRERGQASVELVGLIALVALVFAALALVRPDPGVGDAIGAAITAGVSSDPTPAMPASSADRGDAARLPEDSWAEPRAIVDRYLAADLDEFLAYRVSPDRDPRLDYSTDFCSAPLVGSTGGSFDFSEPCLRHDFGYRNYDRLGLFRQRKDAVDERFLADMRDHCVSRPSSEHDRCLGWARAFHAAVHHLGHLSGHG